MTVLMEKGNIKNGRQERDNGNSKAPMTMAIIINIIIINSIIVIIITHRIDAAQQQQQMMMMMMMMMMPMSTVRIIMVMA